MLVLNILPMCAYATSTDYPGIKSIVVEPQAGIFSLILKDDGSVWAWGRNNLGMLGDGSTTNQNKPIQVPIQKVKAIAAGGYHAMALKDDGTVWIWGSNLNGQYGSGTIDSASGRNPAIPSTPNKVPNLSNVKSISAGFMSSFAIKDDGTVWAWGDNTAGELGDGTTTIRSNPRSSPVQVIGLTDIVAVSSGVRHTLALDSNGKVWAWGDNSAGELGDGTFVNKHMPIQVPIDDVKAVTAGQDVSMAIKNDGTVWAWGDNQFGELGDGTNTSRSSPTLVKGLDNIIVVSTSGYTSMALKNDGSLWAGGMNTELAGTYGTSSDDYTYNFSTPVPVKVINNVKMFAYSSKDVLALKYDGTLWAWGDNQFGELGIGTFNDELFQNRITIPTKVLVNFDGVSGSGQSSNVTINSNDTLETATYKPDTVFVNETTPLPSNAEHPTIYSNLNINGTSQSSQDLLTDYKLVGLCGFIVIAVIAIYFWYRRYR
jgi:alpha-tubulin suppressor-like RCC1 family protein